MNLAWWCAPILKFEIIWPCYNFSYFMVPGERKYSIRQINDEANPGNLSKGMYQFLLTQCPIQPLHLQGVAFHCRPQNRRQLSPNNITKYCWKTMKQKFLVKFSNFCLSFQVGKLILKSFKYSLRRISIVFTANRYGYVLNMNFENMMATSEPYTAWPKVFSMHVAAPWKRPVFLLVVSKTRKISSLNTTPFFQEHNNSFVLGTSSWIVFFGTPSNLVISSCGNSLTKISILSSTFPLLHLSK